MNHQKGNSRFLDYVTILILVDGFLQFFRINLLKLLSMVTILILVDGFLQFKTLLGYMGGEIVTILILVDGFLQYIDGRGFQHPKKGHNPYFSRWFSAIILTIPFY